jgi:hypothetical protein
VSERKRTITLFEHEYANGIFVDVTTAGVTIWDMRAGKRWIVDASCIAEDDNFAVASEIVKRQRADYNPIFPAHFKPHKRKAKRVRRPK